GDGEAAGPAGRRPPGALADVQLAGAVAGLAADGVAVEGRSPVGVHGVVDGPGAVGVAVQAVGHDRAAAGHRGGEPRRQVTEAFLAEPAYGGLEQPPVALRQVRVAARAGADDVSDLEVERVDRLAVGVEWGHGVAGAAAAAFGPGGRAPPP